MSHFPTHIFSSVCTVVKKKRILLLLVLVLTILVEGCYAVSPPKDFPSEEIITIEKGQTLSGIAQLLKDERIIASSIALKAAVFAQFSDAGVLAGDYFFDTPASVFTIAGRLVHGEYAVDPVQITIHEGLTMYQIADLFAAKFPEFDRAQFLALAEGKEGYLFPDTYLFLPNVDAEQVFEEMQDTFTRRIASIQDMLDASGKDLNEVIIIASIIEREAWKEKDQRLISGVIWNRLAIGMPLQVDATFVYINGKNTYELTYEDLAIDSSYNTYKYKGLPAGPIANPGLTAIKAAINPEPSEYLYYLADREGNTYYSKTFDGHKRNRALYMN